MAKPFLSLFNAQSGDAARPATDAIETSAPVAAGSAEPRTVMVLGKTLFFKGALSADEDVLLLGRIEGSIDHSESLTIGLGGVVIGDLKARTIIVKGTVEGDVHASECVTVAPSAVVIGDIISPKVVLVEGAKFNGAISMPPAKVADPLRDSLPAGVGSFDGEYVVSAKALDRMLSAR